MMKNHFEKELEALSHVTNRRDFLKTASLLGLSSFIGLNDIQAASSKAKGKIVIIGGGAAGISMAARLTRWLDDPDITLIDPSDKQYYQPGFTLIASGVYSADEVWKTQESCMPSGVKWVKDSVTVVDPVLNTVTTQKNGKISYDFLVLCPGLQINWNKVEGINHDTLGAGNAHCIYDYQGAQKTWKAVQDLAKTGGHAIYTDTYTKHKCGGAPKKICLLSEAHARKQNTRDKIDMDFFTASKELYDVPFFTPRLLEIYEERNIPIHLNTRLKGIDTAAKRAYFEKHEKQGEETIITPFTEDYDFMHFTPPMSAPDFVPASGLSWTEGKSAAEGWAKTNKETLVHLDYRNIMVVGDCSDLPTSKTSAAIRMQVPIAAKNLISIMEGKEPAEKYNGYAACPIVTDYGHVLLCEFDYDKKPANTFPFTLLDMSKEQWTAWLLKVYALKPVYFYGMLNGYM